MFVKASHLNHLRFSLFLCLGLGQAGCTFFIDSGELQMELAVSELEESDICARIELTNQMEGELHSVGENSRPLGEFYKMSYEEVQIDYSIYNAVDRSIHTEDVAYSEEKLGFGETVSVTIPFDAYSEPELLEYPYFFPVFTFILDHLDPPTDERTTGSELSYTELDGLLCGYQYHYTLYSVSEDD